MQVLSRHNKVIHLTAPCSQLQSGKVWITDAGNMPKKCSKDLHDMREGLFIPTGGELVGATKVCHLPKRPIHAGQDVPKVEVLVHNARIPQHNER